MRGKLIIIGGNEDRKHEKVILKEVAKCAGKGKLVVATVASRSQAGDYWRLYKKIFSHFGVKDLHHLHIEDRGDTNKPEHIDAVKSARVIFFTGGDQLKITSLLGGTHLCDLIREVYSRGGTIAGTSAGAAVMSEVMLASGMSEKSPKTIDSIRMAPGLNFAHKITIDQHFAERGRMGRLLAAVAQNPGYLGIGIDENTAIVLEGNTFKIIGEGAVYVLDGSSITYSNLFEKEPNDVLSIFDLKLHILSSSDQYDIRGRRPMNRHLRAA